MDGTRSFLTTVDPNVRNRTNFYPYRIQHQVITGADPASLKYAYPNFIKDSHHSSSPMTLILFHFPFHLVVQVVNTHTHTHTHKIKTWGSNKLYRPQCPYLVHCLNCVQAAVWFRCQERYFPNPPSGTLFPNFPPSTLRFYRNGVLSVYSVLLIWFNFSTTALKYTSVFIKM